jgi:hypothetical protein
MLFLLLAIYRVVAVIGFKRVLCLVLKFCACASRVSLEHKHGGSSTAVSSACVLLARSGVIPAAAPAPRKGAWIPPEGGLDPPPPPPPAP